MRVGGSITLLMHFSNPNLNLNSKPKSYCSNAENVTNQDEWQHYVAVILQLCHFPAPSFLPIRYKIGFDCSKTKFLIYETDEVLNDGCTNYIRGRFRSFKPLLQAQLNKINK